MARKGGWRRRGSQRRGFRYWTRAAGRSRTRPQLERIESLRIPPAWKDVWISPRPGAKLQATGVDRAGRRQYLYHPEFRARQEQAKYDKLIRFAERLPELRKAMGEHLEQRAAELRMDVRARGPADQLGWFRVGNERYASSHKTFGITTLEKAMYTCAGARSASVFGPSTGCLSHGARRRRACGRDEGAARDPGRPSPVPLPPRRRALQPRSRKLNEYIAGAHGRGVHGQGFPHLGRHADRRDRSSPRQARGERDRAEASRCRGDASGRRAPREHACSCALVLCEPGGRRAVSRRQNDRRFPPCAICASSARGIWASIQRSRHYSAFCARGAFGARARQPDIALALSVRVGEIPTALRGGSIGAQDRARL